MTEIREPENKNAFEEKPVSSKESAVPAENGVENDDQLLTCLEFLTAHYGNAKSSGAIIAGMPYDESGMKPSQFCEAAEKLGFVSRVVKRASLGKIPKSVLPCVLILDNNNAVVLLKYRKNGKKAVIYSPDTRAERDIETADLKKDYTGYAIFIHPTSRFEDRTAQEDLDDHNHKNWFWGTVWKNRSFYSRAIIAAVFINLFGLTSPIFIMTVYDRVIPNNAIETGWALAIGAITAFLFDFIMRTLRGVFIDTAGRRIDVITAQRLYNQVLNMKLADKPPSSGAFANMLKEFESVREFMTSATLTGLVDLPFSLLFLFVIYVIGGPIALLLVGILITVMIIGVLIQIPLRNSVKTALKQGESKHGLLVETINGLETIKAIQADGKLRSRHAKYAGENSETSQKSRFISSMGVNIATFLQQSASILIVLMGMYLVQNNDMTVGGLIACVILGGRALAPVGQVANLMTRYHQATGALKTLNDIMGRNVERPLNKQFLNRPTLKGKITFDNVGFVYPGTDRAVLENVFFTIEAGEKVGIIGRVGSGKSTVARLMMGLYDPDEGTVLIDDTDYRQIDPADLRRNLAYIAQDVVLFSGTVKENIAISKPQATEQEILHASYTAGVHQFIAKHPMGYDAPVGERGEGLSGGQRQAIALARAMLIKPSVMICDEPTNSMDTQAETAFTKHIREEVAGNTLILITHRQPLLSLVDRLIFMDSGRVIMDGRRDEVIKAIQSGKFRLESSKKEDISA